MRCGDDKVCRVHVQWKPRYINVWTCVDKNIRVTNVCSTQGVEIY